MNWWVKSTKRFYNSKLYWKLSYFRFYNYWMCFHFNICFFSFQQELRVLQLDQKAKNGRMLLSKCTVCDGKKLNFIREKEASGLLNSLRIKTPLNKVFS